MNLGAFRDFHNHTQILFIHVPKVAGTSIERAIYDTDKWLSGHYYAMDYYREDQSRFESLFSFGFVRNPYDRLISAFLYLKKGGGSSDDYLFSQEILSDLDFKDFVYRLKEDPSLLSWIHFQPQCLFLCNADKEIIVNFVGKYESLNEDFQKICQIGKIQKQLALSNANPHLHYSFYYDQEIADIVAEIYSDDFEIFGYSKKLDSKNPTNPQELLYEEKRKNTALSLSYEYLKYGKSITQSFEWIAGSLLSKDTNLKSRYLIFWKILKLSRNTQKCPKYDKFKISKYIQSLYKQPCQLKGITISTLLSRGGGDNNIFYSFCDQK